MSDEEISEIVPITRNVLQRNKVFGIDKRNWIEAISFSLLGLSIVRNVRFTHDVKTLVSLVTVSVLFFFGIRGIMGRSVTKVIIAEIKFKKNRRKLHLRSPEYARSKKSKKSSSYEEQSVAKQAFIRIKEYVDRFVDTYSESSDSNQTKNNQ